MSSIFMNASFIKPMLLLQKQALPGSGNWLYEIKLDGYRAIAYKTAGQVHLRSRNDKDFISRYPRIASALRSLPEDTVIDGEVVAFDEEGKPSFNALQNIGSSDAPIFYYVFDLLVLRGRDVTQEPLSKRRMLLEKEVLPKLRDPIRYSSGLSAPLSQLVESVKKHGLEGLVAKRLDSRYEPGKRSGAWQKMRMNQRQEFVIGGYTLGGKTFDAIIFGYYQGKNLMYVARTRNGFTPHLRATLMERFESLRTSTCPFANLPEKRSGRWGQGLTKDKMQECRWLQPKLVGQFEFLEWTPDDHLRHSRFVNLREDIAPRSVRKETAS
jgi:DNA ligase D-like protein (predicted ligase)